MMHPRRGFTLIELLITVVILSLVAASVGQVLARSFRTSQSQLVQADMQSNVRTSGLIVPLEFREIGYDSNIVTNAVTSDIESISLTSMQFRAMRGWRADSTRRLLPGGAAIFFLWRNGGSSDVALRTATDGCSKGRICDIRQSFLMGHFQRLCPGNARP